jgi:apolipoprotein N-acyltransferase
MDYTDRKIMLPIDFLCAGSSAALLSISRIYPHLWFVSLFALVPFLWRSIRVTLPGSISLGSMLAISYFLVIIPFEDWINPTACLYKLILLIVLFALYGIIVNRTSRHIGFNAVAIAILWLPLEYALTRYAGKDGLFIFPKPDDSLAIRIGSLFGMLFISFIIVSINAWLLILIGQVIRQRKSETGYSSHAGEKADAPEEKIIGQRAYSLPNRRAPPLIPCSCGN